MTLTSAYAQLNTHERAYVDAYVAGLEQQAQQAGERLSTVLDRPIPPDHVARSRGLLERPLVRAAVAELIRRSVKDNELSPERLIHEYMSIGFSNIKHYFDDIGPDGLPRINLQHLTAEQWSAMAECNVDYHTNGVPKSVKIKLHSKMDALAKLGEYMAVIYRDNDHWKSQNKGDVIELPATVGADEASNMYARMIAG